MFTADVGSARDFATVCFLDHKETYIHVCLAELCRKFSSQRKFQCVGTDQSSKRRSRPSGAAALNAPRWCVKTQLSAQSGDSPQWLITILFLPVQFLDWKPTMLRFAKNCTSTREQFLMLISTEAIHKYQH